jgi:hypothetical protein
MNSAFSYVRQIRFKPSMQPKIGKFPVEFYGQFYKD